MCCVTKDTPIPFIDSNKLKTCRTGLINHTWPISHHITPLVINALRGGHIHTQTHTNMRTNQFQETRCTRPVLSWFNSLPLLTAMYSSNISSFISMLNSLSACIKWFHDASGCLFNHKWNIFVQHVLASLG